MKITIKSIPHSHQRYDTCGDWLLSKRGNIDITVSKMANEKYEFFVGMHEAVESFLCKIRGVSQEAVDKFDIGFESNRKEGNHDEAGFDDNAPYRREHAFASVIEKMLVEESGADWNEYEKAINSL